MRTVSFDEVARHRSERDLWIVLGDVVWDLSAFAQSHPGGAAVLLAVAGQDATAPFLAVHPADFADKLLSKDLVVGRVDRATARPEHVARVAKDGASVEAGAAPRADGPVLDEMLNAFDFEAVAKRTMSREGWAYYSSGADDEITLRENHNAFQRVWLKPRVLVNVETVDLRTRMLGHECALPVYVSATALGRLAHPEGEQALARACSRQGAHYMLPTLSSCSLDEMLAARAPGQVVFSQLYVNKDRDRTREYVQRLEQAGVRALFVTVDAPQLGRREKDMRNKFSKQGSAVQKQDEAAGKVDRNQGVTRAISSFIDASLNWADLAWFATITKMPVVLKGVQCAEDAVLALRHGCAGVVLSNHGGRQIDTARSGIEVLPEVMAALRKEPGYTKEDFQVFVDGGVRRATDVFKALALGATAVGIGRPSIYSLAAFGQPGVERMLQLFKDELTMVMRLMGTPSVNWITEDHVLSRNLADHFAAQPRDSLLNDEYEPLRTAAAMRGNL